MYVRSLYGPRNGFGHGLSKDVEGPPVKLVGFVGSTDGPQLDTKHLHVSSIPLFDKGPPMDLEPVEDQTSIGLHSVDQEHSINLCTDLQALKGKPAAFQVSPFENQVSPVPLAPTQPEYVIPKRSSSKKSYINILKRSFALLKKQEMRRRTKYED